MKPLNIVIAARLPFPLGNAGTKRLRYIVDYLNESKISTNFISLRHDKSSIVINDREGFYGDTKYMNFSPLFYSGIRGKISYYKQVKEHLLKCYKSNHCNFLIFYTNLPVDSLPFFKYAVKIGYKIVFDQVETSFTAPGSRLSFKSRVYETINNLASNLGYKKAAGSFVISNTLYQSNRERYPDVPLCLLPNSTPLLRRTVKNRFSKPVKILYSGTFGAKDGVMDLISAFLEINKRGIEAKLILTGHGIKQAMSPVLEVIKGHENIEYLGFLSEEMLIDTMLDADILAMTRRNSVFANYGFPFKLSEYLATGNPVIATKVSDVTLYLNNKENACLVESENIESISNGLIYLIENENQALEIGRKGLDVAKKHFDIVRNGQKFIAFLNKLVKQDSPT